MTTPHVSNAPGQSAQVTKADSRHVRSMLRSAVLDAEKRLARVLGLKSRAVRRLVMRLGDRFTCAAIARLSNVRPDQVSRWLDDESRESPNISHIYEWPDELLDELFNTMAQDRERMGFAPRRWCSPDESEDDRRRIEAAVAKAAAEAVLAEMRVARGGSR